MRDTPSEPMGLYIHVPFCASTCDFCAFYQKQPTRQEVQAYLEGIRNEYALRTHGQPLPAQTVFWGGGTPGLLAAKDLTALGRIVLEGLEAPPKEWSVELAPASVRPDKIEALQALGVNRFSMGVQSFDAQTLKGLGRLHTPEQVYKAYSHMRQAGVDNLNLDLMLALPGQTPEMLRQDIQKALDLDPEHLSLYCLTFEEDTKLYIKLSKGLIKRDIELEAQLYELAWDLLEDAGYEHYEIANFCKPGHRCQHNVNTWNLHSWMGLGPSAASQYAGQRTQNVASLQDWLSGVHAGAPRYAETTFLSPELLAADSLLFGLRLGSGIDLDSLQERFPSYAFCEHEALWGHLQAEGLLEREGSRIRLTRKGKLVADSIAQAFV